MPKLNKIQQKKRRFRQLQQQKRPFERLYTLIARYIDMRDVHFSDEGRTAVINIIPEEIVNNDVSHIADSSSSALLGALWPNGANSFRIDRHRTIPDSEMNKQWFKEVVNPAMLDAMDNPSNGLQIAFEEAISELNNYGVGSINIKDNPNNLNKPTSYSCWDVKSNFIDENNDKFVDTVYRWWNSDVGEVVKEYGLENVSAKVKKAYDDGELEDKVLVAITIEPRPATEQVGVGSLAMPFESVHFEWDTNKKLKESGFAEFPVPTARYKKKPDEVMGRGAGGQAIPDVIEINAVWEALTIAFEKYLDPALGLLDDGRLGGGDIDTSAGALNVFSVDAVVNNINSIIAPISQTGEPSGAVVLTEKLLQSISQHYMLDRLLDLNNQNEMTLGEANIRDSLRSDSLRKVYARVTAELIIPVIIRTFNILFRKGLFGVIPGSEQEMEFILLDRDYNYLPDDIINAIVQDKDFFEIRFISPAARMLQTEEANGIMSVLRVTTETGAVFPNALDSFNIDVMLKRLSEILGVSIDVLNSTDTVKLIRQGRADAQAAQAQLEQADIVADINMKNSQAAAQSGVQGL